MNSFKPLDEAAKSVDEFSQNFTIDLASLRNDVAKLSKSVAELVRAQASSTAELGPRSG